MLLLDVLEYFMVYVMILVYAHLDSVQPSYYAKSVLKPEERRGPYGTIFLWQQKGKDTQIRIKLFGLEPSSTHSLHVHQSGKTFPNCKVTGSVFNPFNAPQGKPTDDVRRVGDIGDVVAD